MAIMAALSVVNLNSGRNVRQPRRSPVRTMPLRSPELAETPPAMAMSRMPVYFDARTSLSSRISTTVACSEAHRSALCFSMKSGSSATVSRSM